MTYLYPYLRSDGLWDIDEVWIMNNYKQLRLPKSDTQLSLSYIDDILERFRLRDALVDKFGPLVKLRNGREVTWAVFIFAHKAEVGRQILAGQIPTKIVNKKYLVIKRLEKIGGSDDGVI